MYRAILFVTLATSAIALSRPGPATANPLAGVGAVATGGAHTCAVTAAGGVKCWGVFLSNTPMDIAGMTSGVVAAAAGDKHTCVLTAIGGVKCRGDNTAGQLGDGQACGHVLCNAPVDVSGLTSGVAAVSAGAAYTCALTTAGGVKCWGDNVSGQLGDGTTAGRSTPVDVVGLGSGVAAVSTGAGHTCALTTAGGVKCWGDNEGGRLGDAGACGPTCLTPVDAVGLFSGVAAVAAGGRHTCALTTAGGVKCWGSNLAGKLGDGTSEDRSTPADVVGLTSGVAAVAAGGAHTCALTTVDGVKCWGDNGGGQLGDGGACGPSCLTPVDTVGLFSGVAAIAAGGRHTCALTTAGGVKCWGDNQQGQLGDGTTMSRSAPVDVLGRDKTPVGDANCGGTVDSIDAALVLQLTAGLVPSLRCQGEADVNEDGRVNTIDAALILQYIAGLLHQLPA